MVAVVLAATIFFISESYAQERIDIASLTKKEHKKKIKQFEEEQWQPFGTEQTLEELLTLHYDRLKAMGVYACEVVGASENCSSRNTCKQNAVHNAFVLYAGHARSVIRGKVSSAMEGDASNTDNEKETFRSSFSRYINAEIRSDLKESFTLIKYLPGGKYEMRTFFTVNEGLTKEACLRVADRVVKENPSAQKYAEGFKNAINAKRK